MTEEAGVGIADEVTASLEECAPASPDEHAVPFQGDPIAATPVRRAQDATIGQTGADPPPEG